MRLNALMVQVTLRGWDPQKLDAIRRACGWTWAQTAARTGTVHATLMKYVYGTTTPSPRALARIADALGVQTRDLLNEPADPRLTDLRMYAGLNVTDLAARLDLSPTYVGSIVRAEAPLVHVDRWVAVLGVSEDQVRAAWARSRQDLAGG